MAADGLVIGIDVGGTKVLAGVVDHQGAVLARSKVPSRDLKDQPGALLDRIAATALEAARKAHVSFHAVQAVGMCVPGPLDLSRSVVDVAPNLGWDDLPARAELERRLPGTPVFLENDVRAAALGEALLGAGLGYGSLLAIFVGTGVGGGIVIGGQVYHGARGGAGEIGHIVVRAGGPRCPCGQRGCLEALSARQAIAEDVQRQVKKGNRTWLSQRLKGKLGNLTSGDLAKAIAARDGVALRAARRSARYVGLAAGSMVNLLDPEVVVLGGGVVEALGQDYVDRAAKVARQQVLADRARHVPILLSRLGDDAGLLGAALTARHGLAVPA